MLADKPHVHSHGGGGWVAAGGHRPVRGGVWGSTNTCHIVPYTCRRLGARVIWGCTCHLIILTDNICKYCVAVISGQCSYHLMFPFALVTFGMWGRAIGW